MTNFNTKNIHKIEAFIKELLISSEKGHDWLHAHRVRQNAMLIAQSEPGDKLIIELAALLHDIADHKFYDSNDRQRPERVRQFLIASDVPEKKIEQIFEIIKNVSFSHESTYKTTRSDEFGIVQDADRLDAMGAIGIARAFHYGGYKNRALYDPYRKPNPNQSKEEYQRSEGPTLNHFYEKLLLLKDLMNTPTGKKLAGQRHGFMLAYLQQFYAECGIDDAKVQL